MAIKTKELRELSSEELVTRRRDLKHEMINLRVQQQSGQLENPARIFLARKEVARIETIISSRRPGSKAALPVKEEGAPEAKEAKPKKATTTKKKETATKKKATTAKKKKATTKKKASGEE